MTLTVRLSIPRSEVREYREEYMECNPWEISDEEIKQDFLDRFWADKHEYLCGADIQCEIVED